MMDLDEKRNGFFNMYAFFSNIYKICNRYATWQICNTYAIKMSDEDATYRQQVCNIHAPDMQHISNRYATYMQQICNKDMQ